MTDCIGRADKINCYCGLVHVYVYRLNNYYKLCHMHIHINNNNNNNSNNNIVNGITTQVIN